MSSKLVIPVYRVSHKNIIIAGTPGAWINIIAKLLHTRGWLITWPRQDIAIRDGKLFLDHNSQNIEVQNIHQWLCDNHGVEMLSDDLPDFYEPPYPGPMEFIHKFEGNPVVISGTCMSAFLDIWQNTADVVIDIQATEAEDLETLNQWTHQAFPQSHLESVRKQQISKYNKHLKLFSKVFTMTNSEVKDRRFDGLDKFLKSSF